MFAIVSALLSYLLSWFRPKHELALEVLALRHQIVVLKRQTHKAKAPPVGSLSLGDLEESLAGVENPVDDLPTRDRHRLATSRIQDVLAMEVPASAWATGKGCRELIQLIRRMWTVNPTWGSPRIRDELAKLGLQASTATIRKYRPKSRRPPSQSWRTFLQNHAGAIAAMDFFVVPTVTFRLLYVLVVMTHERRKVIHFNITEAPTAAWTAQQIVNAFPVRHRAQVSVAGPRFDLRIGLRAAG